MESTATSVERPRVQPEWFINGKAYSKFIYHGAAIGCCKTIEGKVRSRGSEVATDKRVNGLQAWSMSAATL